MPSIEERLTQCRNEIDELDHQLIELLAKRRAITKRVGDIKSEVGMPIFSPEREASLFAARRLDAKKQGVSEDLIEDLLRKIIQDSYKSQEVKGYRCINPECKKVVVIGGKGQLGKLFVDLFTRSQYQVTTLEKDDWENSETILLDASLVIVAVPIRLTSPTIKKLNQLTTHCILADVTSIKESPLNDMLAVHSGPVVGLHPMFGPDVSGLIKQTIIACEGREPEKYAWLLEQFKVWGATVYEVEARAHDKAMSMVQVMRHFSTIAYGYHLMQEGVDIAQLVDMSSPIYRLELIMVGRLFAQNPILYTDIIFNDPSNIEMMKRFAHRFLELLDDVENGKKDDFVSTFNDVSEWFGDYASSFLAESKSLLLKAKEL